MDKPSDRYPNRTEALLRLGDTIHPLARRSLLSVIFAPGPDPTVEEWMAKGRTMQVEFEALLVDFKVVTHPDGTQTLEPRRPDVKKPEDPFEKMRRTRLH